MLSARYQQTIGSSLLLCQLSIGLQAQRQCLFHEATLFLLRSFKKDFLLRLCLGLEAI
jgi:hypothetical protein